MFVALEACHIIPRSHYTWVSWAVDFAHAQWCNNNMVQQLTPAEQPYDIDSVQNGILLQAGLHRMWDSWAFSINPVYSVPCCCYLTLEYHARYMLFQ